MAGSRRLFVSSVLAGAAAARAQNSGGVQPAGRIGRAPEVVVHRHDKRVEDLLQRQITDSASPDRGGYTDNYGIATPQSGGGAVATFTAAYVCPESRYYRSGELASRIRLAAGFLRRKQLPSGNIDLLTTNLNSPPDTGFVVHNVAPAAILLKRGGETELYQEIWPFLKQAGEGMAVGGVHTPNHRWVVCAALALLNHLEADSRYVKRIDQWLAEGIDIDSDGLYTERSPLVYSPVVNRCLIFMAEFLGRPELLDPVRRNLEAALYLMHENGELVTELSGRQDQNTIGTMGVNWLGLQYAGERDGNGVFAGLARRYEAEFGDLLQWQLLPVLQRREALLWEPSANYDKTFASAGVRRIRRGAMSATIMLKGYDRVFSLRSGSAVVEAVRFASAFFGKGQFVAEKMEARDGRLVLSQDLRGPYYQPLEPPERIPSDPDKWAASRTRRRQSEVAELRHSVRVGDLGDAFELEFTAEGTANVPVSIEINIRDGLSIDGVRTAPAGADSFLSTGTDIQLSAGKDALRISAPASSHGYTQLRGARPKLPGRSIYVTGFSPFRATIRFSVA